jgi:hypothetical protein
VRLALMLMFASACGRTPWIRHACEWSLASGRDAIAYVEDAGVVLRRDGRDIRIGRTGCLARESRVDGIVALRDGWSALVYGYDVTGGNWSESGEVHDSFACVVDFRSGASRSVEPELLSRDLRHFDATVGARTGWLYVHEIVRPVRVVDLDGRSATLPEAGKTIVEIGTTIRTIEGKLEQTDPKLPIYRSTLVVRDYDAAVWPPALRATREIAVGGRTDRTVVSADGRWVAYDGSPYHVEDGVHHAVGDLGLVDLASGKIAFEVLARPGSVHAGDLVSRGDAVWVLASTAPDLSDVHTASWLDRTGVQVGAAVRTRSPRLVWLPSRSRVLVDNLCSLELLDLPPPSEPRVTGRTGAPGP